MVKAPAENPWYCRLSTADFLHTIQKKFPREGSGGLRENSCCRERKEWVEVKIPEDSGHFKEKAHFRNTEVEKQCKSTSLLSKWTVERTESEGSTEPYLPWKELVSISGNMSPGSSGMPNYDSNFAFPHASWIRGSSMFEF